MTRVVILKENAHGDASLIASENRDRPATVYLAKKRRSGVYPGGVWDPVPMPRELRAHLEAAGLFIPADELSVNLSPQS